MISEITEIEKLMTPCDDKEHLKAWIKKYTGLEFPDKTVSRYSDSNPFDFIWIVYRAIMDGKPLAIMSLSGRNSFKTLALSVVDLLSILHDQRQTVHIAMTKSQASRARNYLEKYILKNKILSESVVKHNNSQTVLMIGGEEVGIELIPATPKSCQGLHAALVTFDELASSMDPQNVKGYMDAHGILGASNKGKPAVIVKITSRQAGASLAETELRNAAKTGLKIVKWTTLDATEKCREDRCGTIPTPMWIDVIRGISHTEASFANLPESKKHEFKKTVDTMDGCSSCALLCCCQGDLRKQTSESHLLQPIDDVINKIRLAGSWDWAVAQIMSLKPSSEALVYYEFDRQIHVPGWNAMWERLTGFAPQKEIDREVFVAELKKREVEFIAGIDWGWSSPSTCVVLAVDSRDNVYVIDAMGRTFHSDPQFIDLIRTTLHRKYDIQMYCPDIENGSGVELIRQSGLPVTRDVNKAVGLGVNIFKGFLRIPGTNNLTKMFFAPDLESQVPNVPGIVEEMELYRKKTDVSGKIDDDAKPEKGNDHYLDALRYTLMWRFGRMRMQNGLDELPPHTQSQNDPRVPNFPEIARQQGIQFEDNRTKDEGGDDGGWGNGGGGTGPFWTWT